MFGICAHDVNSLIYCYNTPVQSFMLIRNFSGVDYVHVVYVYTTAACWNPECDALMQM